MDPNLSDDSHERLHADMREMLRNYKKELDESYVDTLESTVDALREEISELKGIRFVENSIVFFIGVVLGYSYYLLFS